MTPVARAYVLSVALAALMAGGCLSSTGPDSSSPSGQRPSGSRDAVSPVPAGTGPRPHNPAGPATRPGALSQTPRALRPVRIVVPVIGVDAKMTDLGIARDGSMEVPAESEQAGWLRTTSPPGKQGPAVVAGHVDSRTGPAVFYRVAELAAGDEVVITRRDGTTVRFTVDDVRAYPQDEFPTDQVYGPVPGPALRLITCGGAYLESEGGYQDNVVVYAS